MTDKNQILEYINERTMISVQDVCSCFDISESTARRIIKKLADNDQIVRIHGGAYSKNRIQQSNISRRFNCNKEAKEAIAKLAAGIILDNSTIIMLGGTTVCTFSKYIKHLNLTVITNSLLILNELKHNKNIKIILLGGLYNNEELEAGGMLTNIGLRYLHADYLLMSTSYFNEKFGFITEDIDTIELYLSCLEASNKCCVLADSSKYKLKGSTVTARPGNIQYLFSDSGLDKKVVRKFRELGVQVFIADPLNN